MRCTKNFELMRTEDMHLAAAMMTHGFTLHGCESNETGRWLQFVLLVPDDRKDEVPAFEVATQKNGSEEIMVPYGAFRRALNELRSILRQAKGETL